MQRYWAHFTGAVVFFLAMLGLQLTRLASGSSTWQNIVLQTVTGVVIVGGGVGAVLGVFWSRGRPATARRRKIAGVSGVTWLADVLVDEDSATTLGVSSPAALRPRSYALTMTSSGLGLWEHASDDSATVNIPTERIEGAAAPVADFAATAGQFSIELARSKALELDLSNPVLWGMYPATPNQVQRVVDMIDELVAASPDRAERG